MQGNVKIKEYKRIRNGKEQVIKSTQRGVIKEFTCKGCNKVFSVKGNRVTRRFHNRKCYQSYWKTVWAGHNKGEKGTQEAWNKDLNMETDERVKKNRDTMTITVRGQFSSGERRVYTGRIFKMNNVELLLAGRLDLEEIDYTFSSPLVLEHFTTFVDFFIENSNVCIYIDGEYWHAKDSVKKRDEEINRVLPKNGFHLLRFSDADIRNDIDTCMYKIRNELVPNIYNTLD